jgi:Zn-dependent M28 family amino/carboxypeptidase
MKNRTPAFVRGCIKGRITDITLLAVVGLAMACGGQSGPSGAAVTPTPTPAPVQHPSTGFDGERALSHVKAQVDFGPRPAGSPALDKARAYMIQQLTSYGLKPTLDEFTADTPQGKVKMKNVIAELKGQTDKVIIIASHYDTKYFKEFQFVGANDGGSSTGAVLELARVLAGESAKEKRKFTYWFVFFDGEEAFCREWSECLDDKDHTYGSRHMVERLQKEKRLEQVKAVILLDMIGDRDLTIPREQTSSAWLVETIWGTANEAGYEKEFPHRGFAVGDDDYMAFLRVGVPAVDVIDFEYGDGPEDNRYWHTKDDTLDKVSANSLKTVGDIILLSLPKIEAQIQ